MTKKGIVDDIVRSTRLERETVAAVVEHFMSAVKNAMYRKENVYIRGFGSFYIKHIAAKPVRNITRGTSFSMPAHDAPAFRPYQQFLDGVKNRTK